MFNRVGRVLSKWLNQPLKIAIYGVLIALALLSFDGTLSTLWKLQNGLDTIDTKVSSTKNLIKTMDNKILEAKTPIYVERQARDLFNMVRSNEIIFVFNE